MTDLQQMAIVQEEFRRAAQFQRDGDLVRAKAIYLKLLENYPNNPQILSNLAVVFEKEGSSGEAITLLRRAIEFDGGNKDALFNLGRIYQELGDQHRAETYYKKVLELDPGHASALNNSGVANARLGNSVLAKERYQNASEQSVPSKHSSYNHSLLSHKNFDRKESMSFAKKSVDENPSDAYAHFNLAANLKDQHRYLEAAKSYLTSLDIDRNTPYAKGYLAYCLANIGFWSGLPDLLEEIKADINANQRVIDPFSASVLIDDPVLLKKSCEIFSEDRFPPQTPLWTGEEYVHDRIRIGYLSADYHEHATAYLMAEFFEEHDASQVETFAISFGRDSHGEMRQRLVSAFDHFIDVRDKSDQEVAELMRELEIDIAIDLKGYTADARPGILAYRPCPVQAQYLGFPGTMGAPYIDYIIADDVIIPESHEQYYTEKVIRLPGCYQPRDSRQKISDRIPTRAEEGLPEDAFVYCCFNNNYKITPQTFDVWMAILQEVPNSVLWLYEGNSEAPNNLRIEAQNRGVDPNRLIFAKKKPLEEHLARHQLADLFLDTLPCNAHTTARDALTAGLPVLTMMGQTFAGRVAASVGQDYRSGVTVVNSIDEYQNAAIRFSSDLPEKPFDEKRIGLNDDFIRLLGNVTPNKGSCVTLSDVCLAASGDSCHSDEEIELLKNDLESIQGSSETCTGTVWSSYLTQFPDPQSAFKTPTQKCRRDDISYVFPIAASCHFHGLPLTIFTDEPNLSVQGYLDDKKIVLELVDRTISSANDERFFIYRERIRALNDDELVLITDCSDVYFKRNPFEYLANVPGLIFGEDIEATPIIGQNSYLVDKYNELMQEGLLTKSDVDIVQGGFLVNAGVFGGKVKLVKPLLEAICGYLEKWAHLDRNFNMPAVNLAANRMNCPVWVGKPFTSGFKKFEVDSSYYVVHK
jgi:predicted O-linked N-acetylglucosamine transferase (SPINDLY family)